MLATLSPIVLNSPFWPGEYFNVKQTLLRLHKIGSASLNWEKWITAAILILNVTQIQQICTVKKK